MRSAAAVLALAGAASALWIPTDPDAVVLGREHNNLPIDSKKIDFGDKKVNFGRGWNKVPPENQRPVIEKFPVEEPAPWTPPPPPADPSWEAAYRRCFTDGAHGVRALDFGAGVAKEFLTIDVCLATCAAQGFKLAGLEYGSECYCGNALQGENVPTLDERCDLPCLGNNKTTCGGRGALALYVKDKFDFTEGKAFDGLGGGFDGYEPVGCYQDFHPLDRTLKVDALRGPEHHAMTPELCIADCKARGFPLAGLEYGRQCFCGHDRSGVSNKTEDFFCNQGCTGNAQQFCGGNWNLVIYSKDAITPAIAPPPPPPPPAVELPEIPERPERLHVVEPLPPVPKRAPVVHDDKPLAADDGTSIRQRRSPATDSAAGVPELLNRGLFPPQPPLDIEMEKKKAEQIVKNLDIPEPFNQALKFNLGLTDEPVPGSIPIYQTLPMYGGTPPRQRRSPEGPVMTIYQTLPMYGGTPPY
ncbi:WSC-domain-containing protein [Apiospora marii]|uniref:WSC-domain-containing protein n=1 Tax=Apiospora marii TaxID=335849 RepID=A0ABR1RFG6_9PEZI